jgi:hypothetical protein
MESGSRCLPRGTVSRVSQEAEGRTLQCGVLRERGFAAAQEARVVSDIVSSECRGYPTHSAGEREMDGARAFSANPKMLQFRNWAILVPSWDRASGAPLLLLVRALECTIHAAAGVLHFWHEKVSRCSPASDGVCRPGIRRRPSPSSPPPSSPRARLERHPATDHRA